MEHIPQWFYIVMPIIAGIGVLAAIWFPVRKRMREKDEWIGEVNAHKSNVTKFMEEIRRLVDQILQRLPPEPTASERPVKLTDFGRAISNDLDAKEWVKRIAPQFMSKIPKGAEKYEVFERCVRFVKNKFEFDERQEVELRKVAYQHGIEYERVLDVLVIELRDELLASLYLV